jgi:serralysin
MMRLMVVVCAFAASGLFFVPSARASFHLWGINEVYSDATGTVQFVEMFTDDGGELFTGGTTFTSTTKSLTLDHSFGDTTAQRHFLMATPAYAALPGVPAPDFVFPSNNFFAITGDTLTYQFASGNIFGDGQPASLTFTGAQLPKDGIRSLRFNLTQNTSNSPTNFAGQTGTVPEPGIASVLALLLGSILSRRR